MDYLEIVDAHGRRRQVELNRPRLLIGREPTCDVYLPHPSVSRRHAQLQQTEHGHWMLQDLNSLNHVYVENRPVQQILLEPGTPVRIAEYRLTLLASLAATEPEPGTVPMPDLSEAWAEMEPAWLEHMQAFQRSLLRLEEPQLVLERLALEFRRITRPEMVAVGLAGQEYRWEVLLGERTVGNAHPTEMDEADKRVRADDSEVQMWNPAGRDGDTPSPATLLCLLFPMKGRSGIIGHVYLQRPRVCPLPPPVQRYLTLLATHAGLVWDNLHLAALRLAQKVIEQQLRHARQIQIELFPATTELDERLNASAVNLPSVHVSGDYYDLLRTGPDTVAFVIADAMGHGMPAALMMAAVRSALRMGLSIGLPWPALFQGLDGVIAQASASVFVTGLVGQIDLAAGQLYLVSAGHYPPSILVDGRPVAIPEQCRTRPWGLDFESRWEVGCISLAGKDWSILCFTDGITDATMQPDRIFGARRVAAYHQANHHLPAEDLCQGLISEVAALHDPSALGDDQTVLVLRAGRMTG